jgi:hypothetical protein
LSWSTRIRPPVRLVMGAALAAWGALVIHVGETLAIQ